MATYDYLKSKNGHKIQVESAKRDGAGKNIENNYAKQNGYYAQLTAGLADNLTPYSEDSGDLQENPFISNGTGTNNNQEIVTVGDYALVQEKQGNSVVVNQLAKELNSTNNGIGFWYGVNHIVSYNNNVATLTVTGDNSGIDFGTNATISFVQGHKYLVALNIKSSVSGRKIRPKLSSAISGQDVTLGTNNNIIQVIDYNVASSTSRFAVLIFYSEVNDVFEISDYQLIDLTQWFNDDIPADLLANPSHWSWYQNFGDYIAYNTGSLESANGVKLVSTGRNLFDGELQIGGYSDNGVWNSNNILLSNKNPIRVIPNTQFRFNQFNFTNFLNRKIIEYDENGNFVRTKYSYETGFGTMSERTRFIRFVYANSSSYFTIPTNPQIVFSLYYTPEQGGEGYDKYYPYEEPTIVDTGSELLLSAGSVRDYKTPDGTIHRRVKEIKLNTLTFTQNSWGAFYAEINDALDQNPTKIGNIISNKYPTISYNDMYNNGVSHPNKYMSSRGITLKGIIINDTSYNDATTFMASLTDDDILYYELATETTEQGTPYPETLPINDYGMLYWLDENDNLVGIPQGAKIFFPVNYKGFVDDVYSRTSGDAANLVVQSELTQYVKQVDLSDQITSLLSGVSITKKIAYKTGKTITITLVVANQSGSTINAGTAFINIGTIPNIPSFSISGTAISANSLTTPVVARIASSGNMVVGTNFANDDILYISFSYAVE